MQTITKLDSNTTEAPDTAILDGWKVIAGNPTMKTWVLHTNNDGKMVSGLWEATPGVTIHGGRAEAYADIAC